MSIALWKTKVDSFVQNSVYKDTEITEAVMWGLAAVLCKIDETLSFHVVQTYICQAERAYLLEHGRERKVDPEDGESDLSYATRVKQIANKVSCPDIKAVVDSLLDVGTSEIVEDANSSIFFNGESFFNRNNIMISKIETAFTILVDSQVHEPYSFADNDHFADRDSHAGHIRSNLELFNIIIEAVNAVKACGTAFRLIERN